MWDFAKAHSKIVRQVVSTMDESTQPSLLWIICPVIVEPEHGPTTNSQGSVEM